MPVRGLPGHPFELRMTGDMGQGPVDIGVDVRCKSEPATGLENAGEAVEIEPGDEATLPVLLLGPGIGIEQVDAIETGIGKPVQNLGGVVVIKADVVQAFGCPAPPAAWPWS
jgi:hypothetical protein